MFTSETLLKGKIPEGVRVGIGCNGSSAKVRDSVKGTEGSAIVYTDPEKLKEPTVFSIADDTDGVRWIGTGDFVERRL